MMRKLCCSLAVGLAACVASTPATAVTLLQNFDNGNPTALFGSWSTGVTNSGATSFDVTAQNAGSAYYFLGANGPINATGETDAELDVTINSPEPLRVLLHLVDGSDTKIYAWDGVASGNNVLTKPLSSYVAGNATPLDVSTLWHMHVQVDPGTYTGFYQISSNNVELFNAVPEPGALALAGCGALGLVRTRRRRAA